jgi:hypothetical protein
MDETGQRACDAVYLIHSHRQPQLVTRLVRRLLDGNPRARVVVHHDEARSHLDLVDVDHERVDVLRHTQAIEWGTADQLHAILRSLRWIDSQLDYSWLLFVSGQDYPLRPPLEIQRFLLASGYDAFIEQPRSVPWRFRDESGARDFWSTRYYYAYYPLPRLLRRLPAPLEHKLMNGLVRLRSAQPWLFFWTMPHGARTRLGIRRLRHPFREGFRCYCGSDSFTWSRKAVDAVLDFVERRPDVLGYYERTIHPSESFFNTVLLNTPGLKLALDNYRYDRFGGPEAGHPDILGLSDLELLVSSENHFARKFDVDVDAEILDALDRHIERNRATASPAGTGGAALVP